MIRYAAPVLVLLAIPATAAELDFLVGGFDRISLSGSPDVAVDTGRTPSVRATGE